MEISGWPWLRSAAWRAWLIAAMWAALLGVPLTSAAQTAPLEATLEQQVRDLALAATRHAGAAGVRVAVEVGQLDPRLRLAPCQRIEPYLPAGTRLWGRARIGLKCTEGPARWNVYLPITVHLYGRALVAAAPLPAGAVLAEADLASAEVDLAEDASPAVADARAVAGRTLARALNPGQSVRHSHLKARQWFAAGETVKVVAVGSGFAVTGEGQALTPGIEGQSARVRTEGGRVLSGTPVGAQRMEIAP